MVVKGVIYLDIETKVKYYENINWYPGHMAKTRRMLEENIRVVDAVIEIIDARIPHSSRNPDFDDITESKPRLIVLNKSDLTDRNKTEKWINFYKSRKINAVCISCSSGMGINKIAPMLSEIVKEKIDKYIQKGINKDIKVMVLGIPNVGKSSLINRLAGKAAAKAEDRPGVTKAKQWVRLKNGLELLDTPGILPPKLVDQSSALKLAYIGSIRDEIIETELIAYSLLEKLRDSYPKMLMDRYGISDISELEGYEILEMIGRKRGCLISGGEIDEKRASDIVLDDFRSARIGYITLEVPEECYDC